MKIKNKIKENRARLGITQATLAKKIGLSRPTMGKIENGHTPNLLIALKLAEAFEVSIDELFKLNN